MTVRGTHAGAPIDRVARGGLTAFVVYSAGVGLTYCSQLVIARMVGVQTYGIYAYVFAWMSVLAYFSALGFDVALLRFVPAYEAVQDWARFRGVIRYAERRVAIVGTSIALIGACIVVFRDIPIQLRNTLLVGFMVVPIWALLWVRCSVVRAFGGVVSAVAPDRVIRDGVLVCFIALATVGFGWSLDAPMVMLAALASSVIGLLAASVGMRKSRPRVVESVLPAYDAATWRRAALPLVLIGATEAMLNRTGVILLGWMGNTTGAGIYSLAFNVAFVVALPRIALNTLFAPTISSLFTRRDQAMMQMLVTKSASWTLSGSICIALGLFILAEPILGWFGPGYEAGVPALRILLFGQVLAASAGSQLYLMTMTGHERAAAALLIASALINAAVSVVLISLFGLTGAAIGTAAVLIAWNTSMALFLWRRLNIVPGVYAACRPSLVRRAGDDEDRVGIVQRIRRDLRSRRSRSVG